MPYHLHTAVYRGNKCVHRHDDDVADLDKAKLALINLQMVLTTKFKAKFTRRLNGSFTCKCKSVGTTTRLEFSAEFYMAKGKGFVEHQLEKKARHATHFGKGWPPKTKAVVDAVTGGMAHYPMPKPETTMQRFNREEDERINAILREHGVKVDEPKPFNPVLSVTTKVTDDE